VLREQYRCDLVLYELGISMWLLDWQVHYCKWSHIKSMLDFTSSHPNIRLIQLVTSRVSTHDIKVTSFKMSPFPCPVTENYMWIEPLFKDQLSYKAMFLGPKSDLLIQIWLYLDWKQKSQTNTESFCIYIMLTTFIWIRYLHVASRLASALL
jgi:hypothetical protein